MPNWGALKSLYKCSEKQLGFELGLLNYRSCSYVNLRRNLLLTCIQWRIPMESWLVREDRSGEMREISLKKRQREEEKGGRELSAQSHLPPHVVMQQRQYDMCWLLRGNSGFWRPRWVKVPASSSKSSQICTSWWKLCESWKQIEHWKRVRWPNLPLASPNPPSFIHSSIFVPLTQLRIW